MFIIPPIGRIIRRAALLTQVLSTVLVFVVLLAFALISWQSAEHTLQAQRQQVIDEKLAAIREEVKQHMETSGVLLQAGTGFFNGSSNINREEWGRFFSQFEVAERFDGVSTVGYAPLVREEQVAEFEQDLRDDGLPSAKITPEDPKAEYVPVFFSESYRGGTPRFGFDMSSDKARQAALEKAGDSGQVTMTGLVQLTSGKIPGLLLYMPVYNPDLPTTTVSERRAALQGYVYAGLRVNELFEDMLAADDTTVDFRVRQINGDNPTLLYASASGLDSSSTEQQRSSTINLYGQAWEITLFAHSNIVSETDRQRPGTILAGGMLIALVVSMVVYLLIQYRTRTFALAEEHRLQQAKDELLSLASHQLRTPATGVKQYMGMVIDGFAGKVPKEQKELLEQAYKSNERQLQIINEFLYVAKIGSGSLTTTEHKFDLIPVVRDVVAEMDSEIREKGHKLTVKTPKAVNVLADEHSIRMIIENLISNAIKYTPSKGNVQVRVQRGLQEVRVSVSDTGIGIAKKDIPLLFKQFSRIPNELSSEVNGSGIGLYLAQQLAMRNKGKITVESEPGKGSTFILHLPSKTVRKFTKNTREQ